MNHNRRGSIVMVLGALAIIASLFGIVMAAKGYASEMRYQALAEDYCLLLEEIEKSEMTESQIISNITQALSERGFRGLDVNFKYSEEEAEYHCMMYSPERRAVTVFCKFSKSTELIKHLNHEYGHDLWYHVFSDVDRAEFIQIYNDAEIYPTYRAVEKGYEEDFADSYAYYKTGGDIPRDRYNFIIKMRAKYNEAK